MYQKGVFYDIEGHYKLQHGFWNGDAMQCGTIALTKHIDVKQWHVQWSNPKTTTTMTIYIYIYIWGCFEVRIVSNSWLFFLVVTEHSEPVDPLNPDTYMQHPSGNAE